MPSASVIPLLSSWEEYISKEPTGDIQGFARWVLTSQNPKQTPVTIPPNQEIIHIAQASILITRLHRIQHILSKPIIKELGLTKDIEFTVLAQIAVMDHPNKKELCRELPIENSTGVEITKRLTAKGYLTEKPDPNDRRSARLNLTEKGKKTLVHGYEKLAAVHLTFLDALKDDEKKEFVRQLTLINRYQSSRINANPELLEQT